MIRALLAALLVALALVAAPALCKAGWLDHACATADTEEDLCPGDACDLLAKLESPPAPCVAPMPLLGVLASWDAPAWRAREPDPPRRERLPYHASDRPLRI